MLVSQYSYINYQAATSKWNRIRTKRIVQVLEQQATRLERVLEKLEPTESESESSSSSQPVASTSSASGTVSLARVLREFRKVMTDLALLRETLATVKHNNRIVHSWDTRHLHQYELSLIRRKGARLSRSTPRRGGGGGSSGTTGGDIGGGTTSSSKSSAAVKEERVRLDRLEAKRARKVDIWTARLAKSRLEKMVKVEGRGAGDRRFDAELKKLVELREKLVPGHGHSGATPAPSSEQASA